MITASLLSLAVNVVASISPQPLPLLALLMAGGLTLAYAAHRRVHALAAVRQQRPFPSRTWTPAIGDGQFAALRDQLPDLPPETLRSAYLLAQHGYRAHELVLLCQIAADKAALIVEYAETGEPGPGAPSEAGPP